MKTFRNLILNELAEMYDAEHRMIKALPKMARAANSDCLKEAFHTHLKDTEGHLIRLEKVFCCFNQKPKGKTCEATKGILKEWEEIAVEFNGSPAIDAALILAAQKVEHYEIASYGCLREWAALLGNRKAAHFLQKILNEASASNRSFTILALSRSNEEAMAETAENTNTGIGAANKTPAPQKRRLLTTVGPARRQAESLIA